MRTRYLGEVLAMLLVGSSALLFIQLDSHGILSCVPLLLGLYAIHRGATWAAFAVLAGASGLLALTIAGRAPWLLAIGAGSAVVPTLMVLPSLWRFDRLATQILTGSALGLGIAGALLLYTGAPVPTLPVCKHSAVSEFTTQPAVEPSVQAPPIAETACVAADLVGIYDLEERGSLYLDAYGNFLRSEIDFSTHRGTFTIDAREVVLTSSKGQRERMACGLELDGRFTLSGLATMEVER